MNKIRSTALVAARPAGAGLLAAAAVTCALAAGTPAADPAHDRYVAERARCTQGQSNQDRATCLKEAEAAYAEQRRSPPAAASGALGANALKRCDGLPSPEREDCQARMRGAGTTSGSASAGGILRELVTPIPASGASAPKPGRAVPGVVPPNDAAR